MSHGKMELAGPATIDMLSMFLQDRPSSLTLPPSICHRTASAMPGRVGPMGKHAASCIANGVGSPKENREN